MAGSSSAPSKALAPSLDDASCNMLFVEARTETLRMADINKFFICKLCEGYFRDPYTSKECLHTYCYGCIRRYYLYNPQSTNCPICNEKLGAKPFNHIIPDPAMKELGEKLLPEYTAKEEAEEQQYYEKLGIKRKQPDTPHETQPSPPKNSRSIGPSPDHMINFEIYPQCGPDVPLFLVLNKLQAPNMYTQALLKIMYIRKYLAQKLNISKPEEIEILCKGTGVGPEYSLEFIRRTRWKENSKMILEYRRQLVAS